MIDRTQLFTLKRSVTFCISGYLKSTWESRMGSTIQQEVSYNIRSGIAATASMPAWCEETVAIIKNFFFNYTFTIFSFENVLRILVKTSAADLGSFSNRLIRHWIKLFHEISAVSEKNSWVRKVLFTRQINGYPFGPRLHLEGPWKLQTQTRIGTWVLSGSTECNTQEESLK